MPINRTTIFRGPGHITWDGATIVSAGDITVSIIKDLFDVAASGYGRLDRRRSDTKIEVRCRPARWTNVAKLLPYALTQIGQSIFGDTDKHLVVIPRDGVGTGIDVANAAITKMPSVRCAARGEGGSLLGEMVWTGIIANEADPLEIESYFNGAAAAPLPAIALGDFKTGAFTATWGSGTAFGSQDGFAIDWDLALEPVKTDAEGTVDMVLRGLEATCTVQPVGLTLEEIMTMFSGTAIGDTQPKGDLVVTGPVVVTLKNTIVQSASTRYGDAAQRLGALQFVSVRTQAAGALQALWTIA